MSKAETPMHEMTFLEHLQELRVRLTRAVIILAAGFALMYFFRFHLWKLASRPFTEVFLKRATELNLVQTDPFAFTSATEPFFSLMRLAFWASIFVTAPLLFYQVWAFIRPGLYDRERKWAIPFLLATSGCFIGGALFAYRYAFQIMADILLQEALRAGLRANLAMTDYLDLFIYTLVGTGLSFELPVLVYFLARFRVITAKWMLRFWKHATLVIVVASAFLTPGDVVVTTLFFSGVLMALYWVSVLVAWAAAPRVTPS